MLKKILVKEIVGPVIIILVSIFLYFTLKFIIKKIFSIRIRKVDPKRAKTVMALTNNIVKYLIIIVAVLSVLNVYGIDTTTIIASLGIVSLVLGLAIQDTIKDFISGVTILSEDQFSVGDYVTINSFSGYVVSLGLKTTKLRAYTGEIKFISNRMITEVINHSIDYSLALIDISIPFEQNIDKAMKVLKDMCFDLNGKIDGLKGDLEVLGVEKFLDSGIVIRITAKTEPMKQYQIKREILKNIKEVFDKNKINIPYNHLVISNE